MGAHIQAVVDAEREVTVSEQGDRYFDIISFDPRGVNHTTPTISCFPDSAARDRWNLQVEAEGILGSSSRSLRTSWRRANALAEGCSRMLMSDEMQSIAEHVSTASVAADIEQIVEKHGEWREAQARRLLACKNSLINYASPVCNSTVPSQLVWKKGAEALQYWGFSYGTLIGSTFASNFPDRIERMVLDGVVDMEDYYSGTWMGNLADTDKILDRFMHYCFRAGPSKCHFWREGGPEAIHDAYNQLLSDIKDDPLAVPGTEQRGPEIISWTDLKLLIKDALYQPIHSFPILAEMMQDITHGNGSRFADYKHGGRKALCHSSDKCKTPYSHDCILPGWSAYDVAPAVLCSDAEDSGVFTEDDFRSYWGELQNQSHAMGDYWAATRLTCAGWQAKAKNGFKGPFGANTSHPLLFVGNTLDTVTPFRNAAKTADRFPGSGLLRQDSEGHCSFTQPSVCTAKAIRRYLQDGSLPVPGAVCASDSTPFLGAQALPDHASSGEKALLRVLQEASSGFNTYPMFGSSYP
ncbi:hypothetical protein B0A50_04399 [Salinomyces thailandicus]|uniref:Peptidase S33 tripeptidyl aminopeptidase-like C-terminal domain-containing protein n=1 Tax=Salinomyces thailandicus TaxID=706561 RepID=A0A4U0TYL6_9PEZI|nr:hypothetical protein B0A50_04399 [Salinomyces thailandica]